MSGLTGMKSICGYMNRSEATVLGLIRDCDLPACKIGGGIWEADTELIDIWRKEQIMYSVNPKDPQRSAKTRKKPQRPAKTKKRKKP